ncbi:MAG: chain length determinant protein EpsF [Aquabacterium sp.]|uniref:chain length determinant protein EpsF n=1 Tax=Aquabacterium sp. TaxID=1872578 RepID=UPI003BEBF267
MSLDQIIRIIRARWKLVSAMASLVVLGTLITSLLLPKNYTATATLMVDIKPDPVAGFSAGAQPGQYLATQVDLIKSTMVAQRVVRKMQVGESPQMRTRWEKETGGQGSYDAWLADLLGKGLDVKPAKDSSLITINYDGSDPAFAASMANAFAKAFMDSSVQIRVDPARQYADFFEERAKLAREKLERAQARLSEAQQANGIILTDERLDYETNRLNELSTQVLQLRAIKTETDSRNAQANHDPERIQDVVTSPLLSNLKAQLAVQEAKQNENTAKYGDAHPVIQEGQAAINNLRERIRTETRKIAAGVSTSSSINSTRESVAQAAFEAQRERVLKLKGERAKLQVLERDLDSAQRVFDSIQSRLNQMNLESTSSQSNIYLVSSATPPTKATSPRIVLNMVLSVILGGFIAIFTALGIESLDKRVRCARDIAEHLELPVIGFIPAPNRSSSPLWSKLVGSGAPRLFATLGASSATHDASQSQQKITT